MIRKAMLALAFIAAGCEHSSAPPSAVEDALPAGPYKIVAGTGTPLYLIPFDKYGHCTAPRTREHLVSALRTGGYTDLFLFAHGWNTDWETATSRYDHFINGYLEMRAKRALTYGREVKPLFVGIFWPSVLFPGSAPPRMEVGSSPTRDSWIAQERREIEELASELPDGDRDAFYRLIQQPALNEAQARELAHILSPIHQRDDAELGTGPPRAGPDEVFAAWSEAAAQRPASPVSPAPGSFPDPRDLVRLASVWQMKDRAGVVGSAGVASLLHDCLAASEQPRVHLIGHSYGCKVLLAALCSDPPGRKADSVLLLQPAVSALCFSPEAAGPGKPGGYSRAHELVLQPIMSTFSANDSPLRRYYHLALRREGDIGERRFAPTEPSPYAALGGYGPLGCGDLAQTIPARKPPERYTFAADARVRIYGLDGTSVIGDHGDVSNEAMWWVLYCQVAASP